MKTMGTTSGINNRQSNPEMSLSVQLMIPMTVTDLPREITPHLPSKEAKVIPEMTGQDIKGDYLFKGPSLSE